MKLRKFGSHGILQYLIKNRVEGPHDVRFKYAMLSWIFHALMA